METPKQQEKKHGNSEDPQISQPDLRFCQQRKQRNNTKRGRSHTKQKPHKSMGIASRYDRVKHRVSEICKRIKSLWPKQIKGGEAKQL